MADTKMKRWPAAAQLVAIACLCAVCFYAGGKLNAVSPTGKYLVADKNAVVLAAIMERDSTDARILDAEITQPILRLMRGYTDQGFVVIDGAKDEHGNFTIAALPAGTRDITQELAAAVARKGATK